MRLTAQKVWGSESLGQDAVPSLVRFHETEQVRSLLFYEKDGSNSLILNLQENGTQVEITSPPGVAPHAGFTLNGKQFQIVHELNALSNTRTAYKLGSDALVDQLRLTTFDGLPVSYGIASNRDGIFRLDHSGSTYRETVFLSDSAMSYAKAPSDLMGVELGGKQFMVASSATEHGLSSYEVLGNGRLALLSSMGVEEGFAFNTPTQMVQVSLNGQATFLVALAGSHQIALMRIDQNGQFHEISRVEDTKLTRFADVAVLETLIVGDRTFVAAAGSDDGVSLFELLDHGQLIHLDSLADQTQTSLQNVSAISMVSVGGALRLFAQSQSEPGVTELSYDFQSFGNVIRTPNDYGVHQGTSLADLIYGTAGDDHIEGAAGDDIVHDGTGVDTLVGGAGADRFILCADGTEDVIEGFELGHDKIDVSAIKGLYSTSQWSLEEVARGARLRFREETLVILTHDGRALSEADLLNYDIFGLTRLPKEIERPHDPSSAASQNRRGTSEDNWIESGLGNDTIFGLAGDDTLNGRFGDDAMNGGDGADMLMGGQGNDTLMGGDGADSLLGGIGADLLQGEEGADTVLGEGGHDTLYGGAGEDELWTGTGDDVAFGDEGHDALYGENGDDTLDGGAGNDALLGHAGSDELFGKQGVDRLWGGDGNDTLWGGRGDDFLFGNIGNDLLIGGYHNDSLDGGVGNDSLYGNTGRDTLYGGAGDDWISSGDGTDIIYAGDGNDYLIGRAGDDTLFGEKANDRIYGSAGKDHLDGGAGDDFLSGGTENDILLGGSGQDTLFGNLGDDALDGGDGNDWLSGAFGNDTLQGGAGNDTLYANQGDDYLEGGGGDNWLYGGLGADTFIFRQATGTQRVGDFDHHFDRIRLDSALFAEGIAASDIVARYARIENKMAVLDLPDNGKIIFEDYRTVDGLSDAIELF